jgi:5-guanidino-2-oxopentanoate decarboxylase
MVEPLSCGQALAGLLERYGVDTVFGIPGTHTLELYRGLARSRLRHIQPRHEQGAAFMADGYARVSGRPGVCFLIAGPGLLNAATAIAQAYSDSIPMLVISSVGTAPASGVPEGHLHELPDQARTMGSITGFSAVAATPSEVPGLIDRGFASFRDGRRRPVHIALPLDVMAMQAPWPPETASPPSVAAPPDGTALARAVMLLRQSKHPVIILGGGGIDQGAAVLALAGRIGAIVITTIAAKGSVPDDHPLHAGAPLTNPAGRRLACDADVVLALGTELAASDASDAPLRFGGTLIRVDIDAASLRTHPSAALTFQVDLAAFLPVLTEQFPAPAGERPTSWATTVAAATRAATRRPASARQRRHVRALEALRSAIPEDAVVTADMAQVAYTANVTFRCLRPRSYFHPVGLATPGYAVPAAIGAKFAAPERAAIALVGDGGFLFTVAELGTAVEWGLPIVVLLWNNDGLGQIRDQMTARNIPPIAVNPRNPDFLALARAFGCSAARPASVAGLKREIRAALRRRVPTVIEIQDDGAWLV